MSRTGTSTRGRLSLLLLVGAASQRLGQVVDRELAAEGVDARDYALLSLVGVRGPVRLTEVAAELGMPLTTASDAVRRLERRDLVERVPNPEDGRSSLFRLAAAGDATWRQGRPALQRVERGLAKRLADRDATRAALEELGDALEDELTEQ